MGYPSRAPTKVPAERREVTRDLLDVVMQSEGTAVSENFLGCCDFDAALSETARKADLQRTPSTVADAPAASPTAHSYPKV